jgi:hypothetical protein
MNYDSRFIVIACEQSFSIKNKNWFKPQFYLERAASHKKNTATVERNSLNYKDNFSEHNLDVKPNLENETNEEINVIDNLTEEFQTDKTMQKLYLVKNLQYLPEKPLYSGIVRTIGLRNKTDNMFKFKQNY